jgi:putative adhesin
MNCKAMERAEAQSVKWRRGRGPSQAVVAFSCFNRSRPRSRLLGALMLALVLLLALPALAQQQRFFRDGNSWALEISGPLPNEKQLQVSRFVGSVRVVAGAGPAGYVVRLRSDEPQEKDARKQFAGYRLNLGRRSGAVAIQNVGRIDFAMRPELIIQLPSSAEVVHVDTLAGKITVQGRINHLHVQTHGGDIEIDEAQLLSAATMGGSVIVHRRVSDAIIRTGGGDIRIDAAVGDLDITSLGGNILLKAIARAQVQSGGGNIEVIRSYGALQIRSAGGNINLGQMDGDVAAETGGGNIRIGVANGLVVANTAQGNIELWKIAKGAAAHTGMGRITAEFIGERGSLKNSELITSMGDIVVYFGDSAAANLRAVAGSCPSKRFVSEFPELKITKGAPNYGPHSMVAEGVIHGGGPQIEMRTMVGQIEVRSIR